MNVAVAELPSLSCSDRMQHFTGSNQLGPDQLSRSLPLILCCWIFFLSDTLWKLIILILDFQPEASMHKDSLKLVKWTLFFYIMATAKYGFMLLLVQQSLKHHVLEVLVSFSETGPHYLLETHCTWVQLYMQKLILLTQNDGWWSVEALTLIKISTCSNW